MKPHSYKTARHAAEAFVKRSDGEYAGAQGGWIYKRVRKIVVKNGERVTHTKMKPYVQGYEALAIRLMRDGALIKHADGTVSIKERLGT